jgi:hypothetical protein
MVRHLTSDRRPHEPASLLVDIDNQFAYDEAIRESHQAGLLIKADVSDKPGSEAPMNSAYIPKRVPNGRRIRIDLHLKMN